MRIGTGTFFVALGAILTFATNWHTHGLNFHTTGVILMLVGLIWVAITVALYRNQRHGTVLTRTRRAGDEIHHPGEVIYEVSQEIDQPTNVAPGHHPGIYDEVIHPGKAVTYPPPEVLEDPPSGYNEPRF